MTSKGHAGAAPAAGNTFEYYVPVVTAGAKQFPKGHVGAGGRVTYPQPWRSHIDGKFVLSKNVPFGSGGPLDASPRRITNLEVVRAALECGYGRRSDWSWSLVLNPSESQGLARYLIQRLEMVATCIEPDATGTRLPRSFFKRVEATEKGALSFIVGGIGTHLAAREWLKAGGDPLKSFLHAGIYLKALGGTTAKGSKCPDFIVVARSGAWHAFESKGGGARGKWARIVEGLVQLSHSPTLGGAAPTSCVVVHTSVDPGERLHVTAVDPPPGQEEGSSANDYVLLEPVYRLLLVLETLEQFHALADELLGDGPPAINGWASRTSSRFGGLVVAVPKLYLQHESELRSRLALYLAAREAATEAMGTANHLREADIEKVFTSVTQAPGRPADRSSPDWLDVQIPLLERLRVDDAFLGHAAEAFGLPQLAGRLALQNEDMVLAKLSVGECEFTSGGMLLADPPSRRAYVQDSRG